MPTEKLAPIIIEENVRPKGLHAKLAEVMAEADRIPKNGQYQGQGAFKYVMVGDAADSIRKALGTRGVSMLPSGVEVISEAEHATKSGGTMSTITVRTTWTLVDGETGEQATIQSLGTGADSGDKASPKAQTNAMKYALLMGFLLSTGDDPEQSDTSDRLATESLELLGRIQKTGIIQKGGAERYMAEWRDSPDGHTIGFKLKLDGEDRDIPQVLVEGAIGQALYMATASSTIIGTKVTVKGHLYSVRQKGRTTYYRLVIGNPDSDFIETPEVRVPAAEPDPLAIAVGQVAAFSDEEAAAILAAEEAEAAR
jgi:hypothetical protein